MTTTTTGRGLLLGIAAALAMSACVPVRYEYRRPVMVEEAAVCTPDYPCSNAYYWDEYRSVYVFYDGYRYWDATGYAGAYPLPGPNVMIYGCPRGYVPPSSTVYPSGRFVPPPPGRYHPATAGGYAGYTPPGNGYGGHGASSPPGYGNNGNGYSPPPGRGGYGSPPPSVGNGGYVAPNSGYVAPGGSGYAPPPRGGSEPPQVGGNGGYIAPGSGYAPPPHNGSSVTGESTPPRENGTGVEPNVGPHNGYVAPGGYVPPRAGETAGTEPGGFNPPPNQVHGGSGVQPGGSGYSAPPMVNGGSGVQPGGNGYAPPPNHGQSGYTGPQLQGGDFGNGPSRANNFTPPPPVRQMPYHVDVPPVPGQYMPNRGSFGGGGQPMPGQPPVGPSRKSPPSGSAPAPSRGGSGGFTPRGGIRR